MANNPVKTAKITPKSQFQDSENDRIPWKDEGKMATKFYGDVKTPSKSWDTSGSRMYGDARIDMLMDKD
jgi:hypothetical protein